MEFSSYWVSIFPSVPVLPIKFLDHPFYEPALILVVTSRIESLHLTVRRKFWGQLQKQLIFISKCGLIEITICTVTWLHYHAKAVRWGRSCRQSISLFPLRNIFPTKFWQLGLFLIFLSYCYVLHNVCSRDLQFPWVWDPFLFPFACFLWQTTGLHFPVSLKWGVSLWGSSGQWNMTRMDVGSLRSGL